MIDAYNNRNSHHRYQFFFGILESTFIWALKKFTSRRCWEKNKVDKHTTKLSRVQTEISIDDERRSLEKQLLINVIIKLKLEFH